MSGVSKSILILIVGLAHFGCSKQQTGRQTPVERGRYLVSLGGCNDCHTAKVPGPNGAPVLDTSKLLSGHPETAPVPSWSSENIERKRVVAATNGSLLAKLTPHGPAQAVSTGIGEWSEETFIQMARTGKHQGQPNGRAVLPPMPWESLKGLTDDDLKAVWAYLKSLPPVKNQVPFPVPPLASQAAAAQNKPFDDYGWHASDSASSAV
jgi:mono/diheme cytochrome c family protein